MLARLSIRDIVLIDRLDIDFAAGLSVLTATGSNKDRSRPALISSADTRPPRSSPPTTFRPMIS